MRKGIQFAAVAVFVTIAGSAQAARIDVQVNGERVNFPYAQPTEVTGRVMIPLRGVLERLGAEQIHWMPRRQEVLVSGMAGDIRLRIGDRVAQVDGRDVPLDVPPMILRGTTWCRCGSSARTWAREWIGFRTSRPSISPRRASGSPGIEKSCPSNKSVCGGIAMRAKAAPRRGMSHRCALRTWLVQMAES